MPIIAIITHPDLLDPWHPFRPMVDHRWENEADVVVDVAVDAVMADNKNARVVGDVVVGVEAKEDAAAAALVSWGLI